MVLWLPRVRDAASRTFVYARGCACACVCAARRVLVDPWNTLNVIVNSALVVLMAFKLAQVRAVALGRCDM